MRRLLVTLLLVLGAVGFAAAPGNAAIQAAVTSPADGAHSLAGVVPVTVTASADQGIYSVQLYVDGQPYGVPNTSPTGPFTYRIDWDTASVPAGNHTLAVNATDWSQLGGGVAQLSPAITVDVGPAYPTIALTTPQPFTFVHGTVQIVAATTSAAAPATVAYAIDGAPVASPTWDTTTATDGSHTVAATITDGRGKTASASSTVTVDNTAPSASILAPAAGSFATGTLAAKANASDAYGIASVQFSLDGVAAGSPVTISDSGTFQYSASLDISALAPGVHQLTATATDQAGNRVRTAARSFTVGFAPPSVTLTVPPDWSFARGVVTLTAAVAGGAPPASVQFTVDGSPVGSPVASAPYSIQWDTTAVAGGSHTVSATVTDAQARTAGAPVVHVTVDNAPPSVSILAPAANAFFQNTLPASAHASDANGVASVRFAIDGTPVGGTLGAPDTAGSYTYSATLDISTLPNGAHSLTAIATDRAGNTATAAAVQFLVGAGPPTVTIALPPDWSYARGTTPVTATISGGAAPVSAQLLVDGVATGSPVAAAPYVLAWDTTKSLDGTHTIAVRVTDAGGATATSPALHETVDNLLPSATMYQPLANARSNGPTTFQVHASDNFGVRSVQFTVDGVVVGPVLTAPDAGQLYLYTTSFDTSTLAAGTHAVSAKVIDNAGNVGAAAPVSIKTGPIQYLPVINWHEINPPDGFSVYDETPAQADAELKYLHDNGYTAVTVEQYQQWLSGAEIGVAKPVLLTVDDGLRSELAWDPLLQKYGMKAVMFVITGYPDNTTPGARNDPNNMSWADINGLAANGRWQIAFHAGQYGHGDYDATTGIGTARYPAACPYFYSCLNQTTTGSGATRKTTVETVAQYQTAVTNEVTAGMARLKQQVPSASMVSWAAPFNDAGQWTNLYNDPSGQVAGWFPGFMASKFPIVFTQTNPVTYALASGTVGSLTGFGRRYRFEVHTDTTIAQFAAALADPAFVR